METKWNGSPSCGGGWIVWRRRFEAELSLSGATTEQQKLAELKRNVSTTLHGLVEIDQDMHRIKTLEKALTSLGRNCAHVTAYDPAQDFESRLFAFHMRKGETIQEYVSRANLLATEKAALERWDLDRSKNRKRLAKWCMEQLKPSFVRGLRPEYAKVVKKAPSTRWKKFVRFIYKKSHEIEVAEPVARPAYRGDYSGSARPNTPREESARVRNKPADCPAGDACSNRDCQLWHPSSRRVRALRRQAEAQGAAANPAAARPAPARCTHCNREGHTVETCWQLHPEQRPPGRDRRRPAE